MIFCLNVCQTSPYLYDSLKLLAKFFRYLMVWPCLIFCLHFSISPAPHSTPVNIHTHITTTPLYIYIHKVHRTVCSGMLQVQFSKHTPFSDIFVPLEMPSAWNVFLLQIIFLAVFSFKTSNIFIPGLPRFLRSN